MSIHTSDGIIKYFNKAIGVTFFPIQSIVVVISPIGDHAHHLAPTVVPEHLERHGHEPGVSVRLPAVEAHRRIPLVDAPRHERAMRCDVVPATALEEVERQVLLVLRLVALRMEPEADLDLVVLHVDAVGPVVDVPTDLATGRSRAAGLNCHARM